MRIFVKQMMLILRMFGKQLKMSWMQLLRINDHNVAVENLARLCWEWGYWHCRGVIRQHKEGSWLWLEEVLYFDDSHIMLTMHTLIHKLFKQKLIIQINLAQWFHWYVQNVCNTHVYFQQNEVSTFFRSFLYFYTARSAGLPIGPKTRVKIRIRDIWLRWPEFQALVWKRKIQDFVFKMVRIWPALP